ncbi:DNA mismatch repair endonuclease MutL [Kangiella sp. TOML190]|uniref:DNA mismatch repair endonuclease MutL n=1 Tax=Kangiella sp. TOML190 TaxID=2931351 RepID=UPI00203C1EF5|nr:DNA mismatch repair endonuclease MutL [Kangiella sp. TOML190]
MPIKKLSPLIANQIAAGEVVERPASVVKELLENAIDAKADRIQIDIERGGVRLIRITDNGQGIPRQELALALARHATSKIATSTDLAAINTLGFRGEALASISSVAKLTLSSKPEAQDMGWSAYAEGSDMEVALQPHSLPFGTIVEVKDLFFNTPARQKFLKAERTEFIHLEETVKKIALANQNVAITLKHNGKVVKRIPAANSPEQIKQRIASILGRSFIAKAIPLAQSLEQLQLSGWVGPADYHQSSSYSQYFFVNGRPVRDRTINHAVRQAYQDRLPAGRSPAYLIYLQLPADQVDVNVHPTKHEVRFHDARFVHDYIAKTLQLALSQEQQLAAVDFAPIDVKAESQAEEQTQVYSGQQASQADGNMPFEYQNPYQKQRVSEANQHYQAASRKSKATNPLLFNRYYFEHQGQDLLLFDLKSFLLESTKHTLQQEWREGSVKQKTLLIPYRINLANEAATEQLAQSWTALGIEAVQAGPSSLIIRKVPSILEQVNLELWLQTALMQQPAEPQAALIAALAGALELEANTDWAELLERRLPSGWSQSEFCLRLQEAQFSSWLKAQS